MPDFIPPEPPLKFRLYYLDLEHHATALGYVCLTFANLEFQINAFIEALVPCTSDATRSIIDASGASIQTRCELIQKLASIKHPSDRWFEAFRHQVNIITGDICPLRNRLIHDPWISKGDGAHPVQWDYRAPLGKIEARAKLQIMPPKEPERSLESIWNLVLDIQNVEARLSFLRDAYYQWTHEGLLIEIPSEYGPRS